MATEPPQMFTDQAAQPADSGSDMFSDDDHDSDFMQKQSCAPLLDEQQLSGSQAQQGNSGNAVTYGSSKAGKQWKRRATKRQIPCPLCSASVQWIKRHLTHTHKLSSAAAQFALSKSTGYRRRGRREQREQRVLCPVNGCGACVIRLPVHLKHRHPGHFVVPHSATGLVSDANVSLSASVVDGHSATGLVSEANVSLSSSVVDGHSAAELVSDDNVSLSSNERDTSSPDVIPPSPNMNSTLAQIEPTRDDAVQLDSVEGKCVSDLVNAFERHMAGIDGGSKARPEMYSLAVKQVVRSVGGRIVDLTKVNVQNKYIEPAMSNANKTAMSVKTVRSKLVALEYFCKYVQTNFQLSSPTLLQNLSALCTVLPSWRQSLKSRCTVEEVRRRVQDTVDIIEPADIQNYLQSDYAQNAESMLLSPPDSLLELSNYDFVRCRNHLLVRLSVGNAHRTGVLTQFRIVDYDNGMRQKKPDDDNAVFTITEHKTASSHGAATLAVDKHEAMLLAGYMRLRMFAQFEGAEPFVFITTTRTAMTQSNVSSALTTAFNSSGYNDRVTCTKLRKAAVTEIHKSHPAERHNLASHMCHRVATAEKHYRMLEKKSNTVSCSNLLRQTFVKPQTSELLQTDAPVGQPLPYCKRILWSTENRDIVFEKFSDFILREQTPIAEIQQVLYSDEQLVAKLEHDMQLTGRALVQCVKDKVRSFFRHKYGFKKRA